MIKTNKKLIALQVDFCKAFLYPNINFISWMFHCKDIFLFVDACMSINLGCSY